MIASSIIDFIFLEPFGLMQLCSVLRNSIYLFCTLERGLGVSRILLLPIKALSLIICCFLLGLIVIFLDALLSIALHFALFRVSH